jgi:hypothetical protein
MHGGLDARLRFETLIADLSLKFINLPADEVDHEIVGRPAPRLRVSRSGRVRALAVVGRVSRIP